MEETQKDRCDVDEYKETFAILVVAGSDAAGVLRLVEAAVDDYAQFPGHAHRCHWNDAAHFHTRRILSEP